MRSRVTAMTTGISIYQGICVLSRVVESRPIGSSFLSSRELSVDELAAAYATPGQVSRV